MLFTKPWDLYSVSSISLLYIKHVSSWMPWIIQSSGRNTPETPSPGHMVLWFPPHIIQARPYLPTLRLLDRVSVFFISPKSPSAEMEISVFWASTIFFRFWGIIWYFYSTKWAYQWCTIGNSVIRYRANSLLRRYCVNMSKCVPTDKYVLSPHVCCITKAYLHTIISQTDVRFRRSQMVGKGDIQVLRNAVEVGGVSFSIKKRYEGVRFNVISVMGGWVGVKFPGKSVT